MHVSTSAKTLMPDSQLDFAAKNLSLIRVRNPPVEADEARVRGYPGDPRMLGSETPEGQPFAA
jgi:hypothetical protein